MHKRTRELLVVAAVHTVAKKAIVLTTLLNLHRLAYAKLARKPETIPAAVPTRFFLQKANDRCARRVCRILRHPSSALVWTHILCRLFSGLRQKPGDVLTYSVGGESFRLEEA